MNRRPFLAVACASLALSSFCVYAGGCSSSDPSTPIIDAGTDRAPIIHEPDPLPWTPANLFPALWLDGDDVTESGDGVTRWADKSGNGNHAVVAVLDSGSSRPVTVEIHGHKAISFDGRARMALPDGPSLQWGTDDFTFFAVLRCIGIIDPGNFVGTIYARTTSADPYAGVQLYVTASPSAYLVGAESTHRITSLRNGYDDGRVHLVIFRRSGSAMELRVDGAVAGRITTTAVSVNANDGNGTIGSAADGSQSMKGDIATLLGIHAAVAENDVQKVETYLKERYGL